MPEFWAAWGLVGAGAELYALVRKRPGDTFSENVRPILTHPRVRRWTLAGWLAFGAWFAVHIWRS